MMAFTLVELMAACVIVSTIAMGTYGLMGQAMRLEKGANRRARARAAAAPVAEHLAGALRQACVSDDEKVPAIKAAPGSLLILTAAGSAGGHQRRLYTWTPGKLGGVSVQLRRFLYAGTTPIGNIDTSAELDEAGILARLEPTVVATGLEELSVEFMPLDRPQRTWSERYEGPADVLARIRVTVSGQRVEQVVVPASACLGIGPAPREEGP